MAQVGEAETEFGKGRGVGYVACVNYYVCAARDGRDREGKGGFGAGADVRVGEEEEAGWDC